MTIAIGGVQNDIQKGEQIMCILPGWKNLYNASFNVLCHAVSHVTLKILNDI